MKTNKLKKFLVGTSIVIGAGLMASCGNSEAKEEARQQKIKQEQRLEKERLEKLEGEKRRYEAFCRDSVRRANGYYDLNQQITELSDSENFARYEIDSLKRENSVSGIVEKAVKNAGDKIVFQFHRDIETLLGKYKVSLDSYLKDMDKYERQNFEEAFGPNSIFIWVGIKDNDEYWHDYANQQFDDVVEVIEHCVLESEYGQMRKNEIMAGIKAIVENTKKKLIASRKAIEKQYADYYVLANDSDEIALHDAGEGEMDYGYEYLDYQQCLINKKEIYVYDSKLPVEFFGDKDAEYKLVSVGNDKWYVQKKTASGKIEKTAVFTDKGKIYETAYTTTKEEVAPYTKTKNDWNSFYYEPGANMGVHVSYTERKLVKQAKKEFVMDKKVENRISHLEQKADSLYEQRSILSDKRYEIDEYTDSVVKEMMSKRYGHFK